ncbi:unnamed protein product [Rangifer tarandus platyrhynchus]|uniref:Uncharacterized protein n=1 Tax=Rangifer tarandus platyrhynchus TaxID=3082113 RepID=A0ABN8ZWS7_RANTA|nr:unnamed protein product [Rangifer tarandus platyrhynchus]
MRDAALLPQSSDGETLVEGPAGSDVGQGHQPGTSGTAVAPSLPPLPPKGAGGTGTAASRGLRAQANALQYEKARGTCAPPGPAHDVSGQKMAKGNRAGPRLARRSETHQGAALGISRQDGRVTDGGQPCRPMCQRHSSGTDRWWRWCGRERQRVARKPFQMIRNCFRVTPWDLTAGSLQHRSGPLGPRTDTSLPEPMGPPCWGLHPPPPTPRAPTTGQGERSPAAYWRLHSPHAQPAVPSFTPRGLRALLCPGTPPATETRE